jgi:hypothetical protein
MTARKGAGVPSGDVTPGAARAAPSPAENLRAPPGGTVLVREAVRPTVDLRGPGGGATALAAALSPLPGGRGAQGWAAILTSAGPARLSRKARGRVPLGEAVNPNAAGQVSVREA